MRPHDVFLSYASADRAAAEAVCAALEARGMPCWIAPRDVPAGADWGEAILTAIGRAHAMVLVLSRQTAASVHVRNEVVTAVSQNLALVPVRIEDCQPGGALRLHLAGCHWLNVFPAPIEQHADLLAGGVRLALAADATIEIPRGQAAAMVAAARAARPAGRETAPPARPAPRAVSAPGPVAQAAPMPRRGGGRSVAIMLAIILLLAAAAAAAWVFEAQLRRMLGEAPDGAGVAPAPGADLATFPAAPAPMAPALAALPPAPAPEPAAPPEPRIAAAVPSAARIVNLASATISRLFVARFEEGLGREDWLGQAQITPGNAVLMRAPPGQGCLFNIRVVYVDGRTEDRPGVDLCAAPELRFEGSKPDGSASSH